MKPGSSGGGRANAGAGEVGSGCKEKCFPQESKAGSILHGLAGRSPAVTPRWAGGRPGACGPDRPTVPGKGARLGPGGTHSRGGRALPAPRFTHPQRPGGPFQPGAMAGLGPAAPGSQPRRGGGAAGREGGPGTLLGDPARLRPGTRVQAPGPLPPAPPPPREGGRKEGRREGRGEGGKEGGEGGREDDSAVKKSRDPLPSLLPHGRTRRARPAEPPPPPG